MLPSSKLLSLLKKALFHPPYVCWFNSCEKCADWTVDPNFSCALDALDFKENIGCLLFSCVANVNNIFCSIPISNCAQYVGFWVRPILPASPNRAQRYQVRTNIAGNYMGVCFINFGETPVPKYALILEVWDGDLHTGLWIGFTPDTWYWVELRRYSVYNYALYLNGVMQAGGFSAHADIGNYESFRLQQNYGSEPFGTAKIDYLRVANRSEYPPA